MKESKRKSSRRLKKILLHLRYLAEELDETMEICNSAESDFLFIVDQIRPPLKNKVEENTSIGERFLNDEIECSETDNHDAPDWAKRVFRKIALKTHPDKIPENIDEHERDFLVSSYKDAVDSYQSGSFINLIEMAFNMNLNMDFVSIEHIDQLQDMVNDRKKEITDLMNSFYWVWASSTDVQKEEMLRELSIKNEWNVSDETFRKVMSGSSPDRKVGENPGSTRERIGKI